MANPVIAADGFSYEESAIRTWLSSHATSPMTGLRLQDKALLPNNNLRSQIAAWCSKTGVSLTSRTTTPLIDDFSGSFSIFVRLPGGQCITISVNKDTTIETVKRKVFARAGLPLSRQRLLYNGRVLKDDVTLCDYNISECVTLSLAVSYGPSFAQSPRVPITISNEHLGDNSITFHVAKDELISDLMIRFWHRDLLAQSEANNLFGISLFRNAPSAITLWVGLHTIGDNHRQGNIPSFNSSLIASGALDQSVIICNHFVDPTLGRMSRLEVVKQLFNAFLNRSLAYDYAHHIGLMTFNSTTNYDCKLTALYEDFRNAVDSCHAMGDTALYSALSEACDTLTEFRKTHANSKLRIIVLSDGADTVSRQKPYQVAARLQKVGATVDAIMVGTEKDMSLNGICKATGGLCFNPKRLRDALKLNELETLLSVGERPDISRALPKMTSDSTLSLLSTQPLDVCDDQVVPKRKQPEELAASSTIPLQTALARFDQSSSSSSSSSSLSSSSSKIMTRSQQRQMQKQKAKEKSVLSSSRARRVLQEMRALVNKPHPNFDLYVNDEDMFFWRLVLEAPKGTVYEGGCWLLYVKFPVDYPNSAPEIRFLTPIKSANVNDYGRICHSILDRNYSADVSMTQILECIFGLLLNPSFEDPVDSTLALSFFQATGSYEAQIMEHVSKHAKKTRAEWKKELSS